MTYLWLKALHLIFMVSWFAGIFYLPRLFVNLAMMKEEGKLETYHQLVVMATKLYRFITPFMFLTIIFGSWMLYLNIGLMTTLWMKIKLALVALLIIYHFICAKILGQFKNTLPVKSHIYYRWFNEFPVIILFTVIILAIVKPA